MTKKANNNAKEIIIYIIFGVLTTLVSWTSYIFFVDICSMTVTVANVLSWITSVAFAYITNKIWVFNSREWKPKTLLSELAAFISSRIFTGLIEIFGVPLLVKTGFDGIFHNILKSQNISVKILFTDGLYSKISFAVIVVILNYVFSKLFVFKEKDKRK